MENTENKSNEKLYKIIVAILSVIIIVMVWQLISTKTKVNVFTIEKEKAKSQNQMLQHELDSLLTIHNKIKSENKNLTTQLSEQDSIIMAKADEIQKLISTQADFYRVKRKLDYLRGITQGYVSQIDSLHRVNKVLKDENVKIKTKFEKEQVKTTELTKDKEQLSEKVNLASTLKAYNIKGVPIRLKSGGKKEDVTDKAKRADKIKVTFTLSENLIAASGSKTIYLRIARPDGKIMMAGQGTEYSFDYNGQKIQYSMKKEIDYQNKALDITLYWDKTESLTAGAYVASVFTDGYLIGESQFALK